MEKRKDLAIVLKSIPYEERHKIVTALTEQNGLITVLARNSIQSRRFGGALDLFSASDWSFTVKPGVDLYRLDEAQIRRSFEGLRKDFQKYSLAGVFTEFVLLLAPRDEQCVDLFRIYANALATLDGSSENYQGAFRELALLNAFLTKILFWSGCLPRIQGCLVCDRSFEYLSADEVTCVIGDAGWICSDCKSVDPRHVQEHRRGDQFHLVSLRLTPLALLDLKNFFQNPIKKATLLVQASKKEHENLFRFLEAVLIYHVPGLDQKPMKSMRFIDLGSNLQPLLASQQ